MGRIGARQNQFARESKSMLVRSLKHERSCVRHQRGVDASGNLRREWRSPFTGQTKNHFSGGHSLRIDPVDIGEWPSADMMIDADQKAVFQTFKPGAVNAAAFKNDGRVIVAKNPIGLQHLIGKGQGAIDARHAIVQYHIGLLPHGAQDLAAGQRRTDGVAIRPCVRGKHETITLLDLLENILQHEFYAFFSPDFARALILFFARANNSSTRAFSRSERSSRKYNSGARLRRKRSTNSCFMYSLAASKPSRLRSASRSSPSTSTTTCAERPSSATCTAVTRTSPMRGSASSPSTSVSISSRRASPSRPRWYLSPRFSNLHLEVKRMRISENWLHVLALKCYCRAQMSDEGKYRGNNAIGEPSVVGRWPDLLPT